MYRLRITCVTASDAKRRETLTAVEVGRIDVDAIHVEAAGAQIDRSIRRRRVRVQCEDALELDGRSIGGAEMLGEGLSKRVPGHAERHTIRLNQDRRAGRYLLFEPVQRLRARVGLPEEPVGPCTGQARFPDGKDRDRRAGKTEHPAARDQP